MAITHITSLAQLDGILKRSPEKLTVSWNYVPVIDFHATWCGPCHTIAPLYEALSGQYTNVNFLKCDVDAAREVAGRYNIHTMPTFLFMKGQIAVDQVIHANYATIEKALREHSSGPTPSAPRPPRSKAPSDNNLDPLLVLVLCLSGACLLAWYLRR